MGEQENEEAICEKKGRQWKKRCPDHTSKPRKRGGEAKGKRS